MLSIYCTFFHLEKLYSDMSKLYLSNFFFARVWDILLFRFENCKRQLYLNVIFVNYVLRMSRIQLLLGKINDPLRWHKHNVTLNIFVLKEDQKSQIFLQLTVLLCNIARNWYVSRMFNIKSFLFSLEKAWASNMIFWEEAPVMEE